MRLNFAKRFKGILTNNHEFDKFRLVNAFRIHSNLKRLLVRSELRPNVNINDSLITNSVNRFTNRFTFCDNKRCLTCRFHAYNCDSFTSSTFNANFRFNDSLTCKTTKILYI